MHALHHLFHHLFALVRSAWMAVPAFVVLAAILAAPAAQAFERPFPAIAKRGTLSMEAYPTVAMDGKVRNLSAGSWIRNQNNTIDMPASLAGMRFIVNYTENAQGDIDRVWILTTEEAAQVAPNKRPLTPDLLPSQ